MLSQQRDMIRTPLSRYDSFKELAIPLDKVYEFQNFFSSNMLYIFLKMKNNIILLTGHIE